MFVYVHDTESLLKLFIKKTEYVIILSLISIYIAVILLCDYHYVYFTWLCKHNIFILAADL